MGKGQIDKTKLGLANSKQVTGISFFADVDGFTTSCPSMTRPPSAARRVEIAAGLHASVKHTLPVVLNDAVRPVAIGQALGAALISRLGEHGQPDVVCIGPATEAAVRYQQALDGWETWVSKELRDQLPDELAAEFKWRAAAGCYVATEVTADKLERQVEAGRPSHDGGRTVSERGGRESGGRTPSSCGLKT